MTKKKEQTLKETDETTIEDAIDFGVENGLFSALKNGNYRLTAKGMQYAKAILQITNQSKLETFTLDELAKISADGAADKFFSVGDKLRFEFYTGERLTARIGGFYQDVRADNGKKAGFTFIIEDLIDGEYEMNARNTNAGGWEKCRMRNVYMQRLFKLLPPELQKVIVPVIKKTAGGNDNKKIVETTDKLFLLSEVEVFGEADGSLTGEGQQYPIFKDEDNRVKRRNGSAYWWWLRSPYLGISTNFRYVNFDGIANDSASASISNGVCFGFCI